MVNYGGTNTGQVQGHSLTLHFTVVPYWHYSLYEDSPKRCIVKSSQIYYPIEEIWIAGRVGSLAIPITLKDNQGWPK